MLDINNKIIDNFRQFHITIYGNPSISEFPCMTPLCKVNPNIIIEVEKNNFQALEISSIFKGMGKFKSVDNPINRTDEQYPKQNSYAHMVEIFLDIFGMESDDLIPYILFENDEIEWAFNFIKKYDKPPVIFSPICGGFKNGCRVALAKMLDFDLWEHILEILSKKYTILYNCYKTNSFPIKYTTPIINLKVREIASLMFVCGKYLGVESGLAHLAIASGAYCHVIVPSFGYFSVDENNGSLFNNYAYHDWMWKYQPKRIKYYLKRDYLDILNYL